MDYIYYFYDKISLLSQNFTKSRGIGSPKLGVERSKCRFVVKTLPIPLNLSRAILKINNMLFIIYELIFNMARDKFRGMGTVLTTNRHLERSTPSFGLPMGGVVCITEQE